MNLRIVKVGPENRNTVGNLVKNRIVMREAKREWKTYYEDMNSHFLYT